MDVPGKPYVLASVAVSLDGCIDDTSEHRLVLSGREDLEQIDSIRAAQDAILIGAGTLRKDNPGLVIRSAESRANRVKNGMRPDPMKVLVTGVGDVGPARAFFRTGDCERLVYCPDSRIEELKETLAGLSVVAGYGSLPANPAVLLADLAERGVRRLMIEGGSSIHALFLNAGLVDELRLAVAPVFVGDDRAPRFLGPASSGKMILSSVETLGDVVVSRYVIGRSRLGREFVEK